MSARTTPGGTRDAAQDAQGEAFAVAAYAETGSLSGVLRAHARALEGWAPGLPDRRRRKRGALALTQIAGFFGLTVKQLLDPSRVSALVRCRHVAMAVLNDLGLSAHAIGQVMGGMHRATVLYGLVQVAHSEGLRELAAEVSRRVAEAACVEPKRGRRKEVP